MPPTSPMSPGTNSFSRRSLMNFTAAGQRFSIFSFSWTIVGGRQDNAAGIAPRLLARVLSRLIVGR